MVTHFLGQYRFVGHNRLTNTIVNNRYSKGNLTVKDLSEEYGVSTRTIYRKLTKSYKEELPNLLARPVVVLMDATYWGGLILTDNGFNLEGGKDSRMEIF